MSIDPKTSNSPWHSPYQSFSNNPILNIDPLGDEEYATYKDYKTAQGKNAVSREKMGSQGHWLEADRTETTTYHLVGITIYTTTSMKSVWDEANEFNISQKSGWTEYNSTNQRSDFYGWFSDKHPEVKWPRYAQNATSRLTGLNILNGFPISSLEGIADDDEGSLDKFISQGSDMILGDAWDDLSSLHANGLQGKTGMEWDNLRQAKEQVGFTKQLGAWASENPGLYSYVFVMGSRMYGGIDASSKGIVLGKITGDDLLKADFRWNMGLRIMYGKEKWGLKMPSLNPSYSNGGRWSSLKAIRLSK